MRRTRPSALVGAGLLFCLTVGRSAADDAPVLHPGTQAAPPIITPEPVLSQELDGRRAIRGCAVGETCTGPDQLRSIDVELFPERTASPWLDERTPAPSRLESATRIVKKPSELRPDHPWLDSLELPDLPVKWSQKLVDYLVFYKTDPRGRSIIASWLRDQGRYKELIGAHLRKAKLPQDLIYVAMIESSYDPNTLSRAGALGLWQFMPDGARIYGLRQDRWVDERKDPLRSTIAQMDYFRDLYQRFGDWDIALAAFNVGYGAMLRSIARYNTNDFYKLCDYENAVPWETCLYTPKVLATAIVGHNRTLFGVDTIKPATPEVFDEVSVPASVSLGVIARAAGSSETEIKRLNPHLRRGRTPPGEAGYVVRVPTGTRADTQRRLVELQTDWDGYDAHVVAHGERFEDIAMTYGLSTSALRKLNGVDHESEISGGTVLVVPRVAADVRAKNQAKAKAKLLSSGVDSKDGEQLIVPVPDKDAQVAGKRRVFYRVVTGDSLGGIAKALGMSRQQLATWNDLDTDANLHPKMVLVAWVPQGFDAERAKVSLLDEAGLIVVTRGSNEHMDLAEARTGRVRIEYVATGKEKLADIAKKYGMGSHDLARINRISYSTTLEKGDKIIVYQVVDPKRSDRAEEQWKKTPRARRGKVSGTRAQGAASRGREDDDEATDDEDEDDDGKAKKRVSASDDKKSETKADKKADDSKSAKKSDGKKSDDNKKSDDKKSDDKKSDDKKTDDKKVEAAKKTDDKKSEDKPAKKSDDKSASDESSRASRALRTSDQPIAKPSDLM